jgi:hypothetical protein
MSGKRGADPGQDEEGETIPVASAVASMPEQNQEGSTESEEESQSRKKRRKDEVQEASARVEVALPGENLEEREQIVQADDSPVADVPLPAFGGVPRRVRRRPMFDYLMLQIETQSREEREQIVRDANAMSNLGFSM